jgi:multicomponent Na+:H+ antiporter subunit F
MKTEDDASTGPQIIDEDLKLGRRVRWAVGLILIAAFIAFIFLYPLPILFYQNLPYLGFLKRAFFILLLCCLFCLFRILRGPTAPDRAVSLDILGTLIVGFCAILSISTGRPWYIDIAIAWALQSFIGSLALAKYLEGKKFDE